MGQPFNLYILFHLNLAFSSIEEEDRIEVINRCYLPLIQLMEDNDFPVGIEATGFTLEEIDRLCPDLIRRLRDLIASGKCEFVTSGYSQMIAPLVPEKVTRENLRLGLEITNRLLNVTPDLVLVNEQAYSPALVPIYKDFGFKAMVMDWAEPASYNEDWTDEIRALPQLVEGANGATLPVIWSDAIAFQKFQRVVHGELTFDEYHDFVFADRDMEKVAIALYASDGEVFDYRPGRFDHEADTQETSEWKRISEILTYIQAMPDAEIVGLKSILNLLDEQGKGRPLRLETSQCPVPVKKQRKYNILRWGVSGRDDLSINTACYRLYQQLIESDTTDQEDWKELCYLWSSDFRTHITQKRWDVYCQRLEQALKKSEPEKEEHDSYPQILDFGGFDIAEDGRFLDVKSNAAELRLNLARGCAIEGFKPLEAPQWWMGTLLHGTYDHIAWGADFYSGHMVWERPGAAKVTDLQKVDPECSLSDESDVMWITCGINTAVGKIRKRIGIERDIAKIHLTYDFSEWDWPLTGGLRLGNVTLNPEVFGQDSLYFSTHNGGEEIERFALNPAQTFNHADVVSMLISARTGLGMTKGRLYLGDADKRVLIQAPRREGALLGQINYAPVKDSYFYRASLTARECDDTSKEGNRLSPSLVCNTFKFSFELQSSKGKEGAS